MRDLKEAAARNSGLAAALLPALLSFIIPGTAAALQPTESEILLGTLAPEVRVSYRNLIGVQALTDLDRFDIHLHVDPGALSLSGRVTMNVRNTSGATLREAVLRLWPNAMGKPGRRMQLEEVKSKGAQAAFDYKTDSTVGVTLPSPSRPGERIELSVRYSASIPAIPGEQLNLYAQAVEQLFSMLSGGGGRKPMTADYGVFASDGRVINLGGFYPVPATLGRGGWEVGEDMGLGDFSYGQPANYFVTVNLPRGYSMASTGKVLKTHEAGGRDVHFVVAGAVRDFAIEVAGRFETLRAAVGGTEVTAYFLQEDAEAGKRLLSVARDSLLFFSKKFGPYPYREFKAVEAPITGGAGGVEFPGLVTIAGMLMKETLSKSPGGRDFGSLAAAAAITSELLDFTIAHETAHQWWAALVGSDPRKHPWVDEGLTSYSAALYFEEIYGREKGRRLLNTQVAMNYQMMRLFGGEDRPVEAPVSAYKSAMDYAGIVYGKAPMYHDAIRNLIGLKAYLEVCSAYARKFGFKTAGPRSFSETASEVFPNYKERFEDLDRRWLRGKHGDEDIGKPDLAAILEMVTGQRMDGSLKEYLEEMFPMMKQYR
jgi:aminopeptidase N